MERIETNMKKRLLAVILSISLFLVGCSVTKSSPILKPDEMFRTKQSYDFVLVCPVMDNEYWTECIDGIQKADVELGTNTRVLGPKESIQHSSEIINYMKEAIDSQPDGIMVYSGIEGLHPLINQAVHEGIPVLSIDSDAPTTNRIAYIGTNPYNFGYKSGEVMAQLTGGNAKIGYLCSSFSVEKEMDIYSAFLDAIDDYDMEVVAEGEGGAEPDFAQEVVAEMVAAHPEITAIFCASSYNLMGAAQFKKEQGLENLVLLGSNDEEENLAFLREGVIDAVLVQSPYYMGHQAVHLLREYIDNGKLSSDKYDIDNILVTKENIDTYNEE